MFAHNDQYYFLAHVTLKSSKGNSSSMQNNTQPTQSLIQVAQEAVNPMLTPLTYSQQLMVRNCYIVCFDIILCHFL